MFDVALALFNALYLRGAGLAGDSIGGVVADAVGSALFGMNHIGKIRDQGIPVRFVLHHHFAVALGGNLLACPALGIDEHAGNPRLQDNTMVGNGGHTDSELQGCRQHQSLSDSIHYRFAGIPLLSTRFLPFRRRKEPLRLIRQVHPGFLAEAERRQKILDAIRAERVGKLIEIHVAGLHDRFAQTDDAVTTLLPVAKQMAAAR